MPLKSLERTAYSLAVKLGSDQELSMKSFKKDRIVTVSKMNNSYSIKETGFVRGEYAVNAEELKKKIGSIIDIEFPRSHEVLVSVSRSKNSAD
ncbi:MAG: hypothetical protein ACP5MZ_01320 [Candidatus Micrarchaeia archaeon]